MFHKDDLNLAGRDEYADFTAMRRHMTKFAIPKSRWRPFARHGQVGLGSKALRNLAAAVLIRAYHSRLPVSRSHRNRQIMHKP
jgi:hypothetical protein